MFMKWGISMTKKRYAILGIVIYIIYFVAIYLNNSFVADVTSPMATLIACAYIFHGFFLKENQKVAKISGLLLALSLFAWFVCDAMWGISAQLLHVDPEDNVVITYGYSLTNVLMIAALLVQGYFLMKRWNRMQAFLDIGMVSFCLAALIWVFVFESNYAKWKVLLVDVVAMGSLILDVLILGGVLIWFFSIRNRRVPIFFVFILIGLIGFAFVDIIYYYIYFYQDYEANNFIDAAYVGAFFALATAGYLKSQNNQLPDGQPRTLKIISFKGFYLKKELMFMIVPILLLIFQSEQTQLILILITTIFLYYIFVNYTQNSIHKDVLLEREKEHVLELEKRVEERTEEIVKIMNTDVVTGLKNRRYLEHYLEQLVKNCSSNEYIYLYYIDQNKYKNLKSIYGKFIAEKTLQEVGKRIDLVIERENGLTSAYGEDIFVGVIKTTKAYDEIMKMGERIVAHCNDHYFVENHIINVTVNIGISCYPLDSKSSEELIKNADMAMIDARKFGFNFIKRYDRELGKAYDENAKLELLLKRVDYDKDFRLCYQPQISTETKKIIAVEALIRWRHKDRDIMPIDFIPLTEETGIIIPLGYWIMEKAAKQLSQWRKNYRTDIRMAVNISSKQLLDDNFAKNLIRILDENEIPYNRFEIEITENIQLESNKAIQDVLIELSKMEVSIAIDDFGTGYSSLYYLKHLPISRVKIAKELIDYIDQDIYSKSIVQMMIFVAKVNRMKIIAEGVETEEQFDQLENMGCEELQGYLFYKPLEVHQIEDKWDKNIF